jgi:hypothetical protein
MIEIISDLPDNVVAFTAKGKVTAEDYEKIIIPAIEEKLKKHQKINLLYHLGEGCTGFEVEAMWDDTKIGVKHCKSWDKIAVVTNINWIRWASRFFSFTMPGHMKVFTNDQLDQARQWVGG